MKAGLGDDAERAREQGHGRENGVRLAVGHVQRGFSAPERGVVHRGQVVEDQRGRVHHLDRAARVDEARAGRAEQLAREDDEHRSHALPRREKRFARGGRKRIARILRRRLRREEGRKARVHRGAHLAEKDAKERRTQEARPRLSTGRRTDAAPPWTHQKLASASFSFVKTSNTVMSCVTVRTSLILGGRFTSFSFAPLFVAVV